MSNAALQMPSSDDKGTGQQDIENIPNPQNKTRYLDSGVSIAIAVAILLYLASAGPIMGYYIKHHKTLAVTWHSRMAENFYTPMHCAMNMIPGSRQMFYRYLLFCMNNINYSIATSTKPVALPTPAGAAPSPVSAPASSAAPSSSTP
ncbi:MAG TPA: hypothetical protein VK970_14020 [Candidatus Methylacidiphilales bacterium]|nr:hypothetical protein [Candidatus Methylacidiphilales bacterium]